MVKAIIFDCFGVLATEGWRAFKYEHFGNSPELMEKATGIGHRADKGQITREKVIEQTAQLAGITTAEAAEAINGNRPNEELFDYLRDLKKDYKLGFLSNISDDYLHEMFSATHLKLFDHIEMSYRTGKVKPEAEAYQNAAKGLGVAVQECVMVDDLVLNIEGAQAVGMLAVLYENVDQLKRDLAPLLAA